MSDWKPGDGAICVNDKPCPVFGPTSLVKDRVYLVVSVKTGACRQTGYRATCLKLAGNNDEPPWHNQRRFRKIEPHEFDEDDLEVIDLYKRTPEPADLQQVGASSRWVETPSPNGSLPTGGAPITENGASP